MLLGSVGALALGACDGEPEIGANEFIRDEAQCRDQADPAACREALAEARARHQSTAPAFNSREACEAKFGVENCAPAQQRPTGEQIAAGEGKVATDVAAARPEGQQTAQAGGGWFLPLMMGYMMGRTMGGGVAAQPVWRDASNRAYSGTRPLGRFDDRVAPAPRLPGTPAAVERGGFGRSAVGSAST